MTSLCANRHFLYILVLTWCVAVLAQTDYRAHNRQVKLTGRKHRVSSRHSSSHSQDNQGTPNQWANIAVRGSSQDTSRRSRSNGRLSPQRSRLHSSRRQRPRASRPNIVVIMTDDQDVLLGSLKVMPKLQRLMINQGVYFNNSFVTTPMCCPSRSSFLTGLYVHNHHVLTNNQNCSSQQWREKYESRSFATYINSTYATGYFGKYLNEYSGDHTPDGWQRWVGLIRNTRFYNYSVVNERGVRTEHYDNYYKDYLTDLVANDSITFLQDNKRRSPDKPVMMMLSLPAPHGPEDAAPQHQHMFENNTDHRTPAWNYASNEDKQLILQHTLPMTPQFKKFTDMLQRKRLQTLQSVDDLIEKVVDQLDMIGELSNTYILYTSDHGYHLGQFGLIKGKGQALDTDVRVPLIMRGPGIRPGSVISNMVSNVDIAPTILDLAGVKVPSHMDGQSVVKLLKASKDMNNVDEDGFVALKRPWRDTILLEKGKTSVKIMKERMRTEEINYYATGTGKGKYFFGSARKRKLYKECANGDNRLPCKPNQKWYCIEDNGRLRKHKCRSGRGGINSTINLQRDQPSTGLRPCPCSSKAKIMTRLARKERRKHRRALRQGVKLRRSHRRKRSIGNNQAGAFKMFEPRLDVRCRILSNSSVHCDQDIYHKPLELEHYKETIEDMIKEYKKALADLKDIRKHLVEQRDKSLDSQSQSDQNDCLCDHRGKVVEAPVRSGRKGQGKTRPKNSRRRKKKNNCNVPNMTCFTHDNSHWKTPPYWTYGPFCFCANSYKGTYWCLRTINQTHDFMYCEFITLFMSYYDFKTDPYQMTNIVTKINYGVLQQLHDDLDRLKGCQGAVQCSINTGSHSRRSSAKGWEGLSHLKSQRRSRKRYVDELANGEGTSNSYNQRDYRSYYTGPLQSRHG